MGEIKNIRTPLAAKSEIINPTRMAMEKDIRRISLSREIMRMAINKPKIRWMLFRRYSLMVEESPKSKIKIAKIRRRFI
jgi:hypothetical protein